MCAADCVEQDGVTSTCGDGIVDREAGEGCDDANSNEDDGCNSRCIPDNYAGVSVCENTCLSGAGEVGTDGVCDDGGPGAATSSCGYGSDCQDCGDRIPLNTEIACGNGLVEEGEQCDDGNRVSQDGCDQTVKRKSVMIAVCDNDANNDNTTCAKDCADVWVETQSLTVQGFATAAPPKTIMVVVRQPNETVQGLQRRRRKTIMVVVVAAERGQGSATAAPPKTIMVVVVRQPNETGRGLQRRRHPR